MKKRSLKNYTKSYNVRLNQLPPRYADEAFQGFSKYIETEPRLTLEALWVLPLRNFFPPAPRRGENNSVSSELSPRTFRATPRNWRSHYGILFLRDVSPQNAGVNGAEGPRGRSPWVYLNCITRHMSYTENMYLLNQKPAYEGPSPTF